MSGSFLVGVGAVGLRTGTAPISPGGSEVLKSEVNPAIPRGINQRQVVFSRNRLARPPRSHGNRAHADLARELRRIWPYVKDSHHAMQIVLQPTTCQHPMHRAQR